MVSVFDVVIGLAYLFVAAWIFDRVLATMRRQPFTMFAKFWGLGVACGLFGLGRLTDTTTFYDLAHVCLLAYAVLRIQHVTRGTACRWGRPD